jgi:hypothetical protein
VANLFFRAFAAVGFLTGALIALSLDVAGPKACDIADGDCLALVLRHEALVHVLPPVAGLLIGVVLGSWAARAVHRVYGRKALRMG